MAMLMQRAGEFWTQPRDPNELLARTWPRSLAAIIGGTVVSFLLFGLFWPYWRIADADLFFVYEAFLYNDGLPQEFSDHPGYLTILLLGWWLRLLHAIGLVKTHAFSLLPTGAEAAEAWRQAVYAGRVLSLMLALAFLLAFAALLRRLIGDWRVAAMGAFLLAFSGGFAMHARIVRTELISGGLMVIALLVLMIAARNVRSAHRPLLVGAAALLAMLALENKVQAIFFIGALPVIMLAFGAPSEAAFAFWRTPRTSLPALAAYLLGATAAIATTFATFPMLASSPGTFGIAILAWIAAGMLVFAMLWRVPPAETLAAYAAVAAGCSLGLMALAFRNDPQVIQVVINPLQKLVGWGLASNPQMGESGQIVVGQLIGTLIEAAGGVLARYTFVLKSSARPTIFLMWFVIAAAIMAVRAGERKLFAQVAVLVLAVLGLDTVSMLRGLKLEYFLYSDPLVVIAAALLVANFGKLRQHRLAFQIGIVLFWSHVLVSQAEPVKHTFLRSVPTQFCVEHFAYTKRVERLPFCFNARS